MSAVAFDFGGIQGLAGIGVVDTLRKAGAMVVPPEKLDPVSWGVAHRQFSSKENATQSRWNPERTPWVKEILWELSDESPAKIVVCPKGAQVGFTELGFVWMGWAFDQDPGTMIVLWPTDAFIKRQVKQRIDPFFESAAPLKELFGAKKDRATASTLFQKSSPVGELILASARSAANLRGTPAVRAMADEIDVAPEDLGEEGDVIELLLGRLSDAGLRAKLFIPCTPKIEHTSIVWRWWKQSDQRQFLVPCPHCGTFQPLVWSQMRIPEGSPRLAQYECAHCGRAIGEHAKPDILPQGRFEATATALFHGCVGKHVSSLYAPLGSFSWADMATQWVGAGAREAQLKTFFNIRLGLPWKQTSDAPDAAGLEKNKEPLAPGVLPVRCGMITAGADVQGDRIEVRFRGWGPGLESWYLGKVVVPRQMPKDDNPLVKVDRPVDEVIGDIKRLVLDARWQRADGAYLSVRLGLQDVNFDTTWAWAVVRGVIERCGDRWGAIRGVGGDGDDQGAVRQAVLVKSAAVDRDGIANLMLHRVSSPMAFSEFYRLLRQPRPDENAPLAAWEGFQHLPDTIDDAEISELTSDREIYDTKKKKRVWTKSGPNEAGDCFKYARAALEVTGASTWSKEDWAARFDALDRLAAQTQAAEGPKAKDAPPAKQETFASSFLSGD